MASPSWTSPIKNRTVSPSAYLNSPLSLVKSSILSPELEVLRYLTPVTGPSVSTPICVVELGGGLGLLSESLSEPPHALSKPAKVKHNKVFSLRIPCYSNCHVCSIEIR